MQEALDILQYQCKECTNATNVGHQSELPYS